MTTDLLLERINQQPFRPFSIETIGGTWIVIERSEDVQFRRKKNGAERLVVFDPDGTLFILAPEQIATINGD